MLAEAAAVAVFCGLVWLPVRALTGRARGRVVIQLVVYALAACATTAAATAVGAWREHLRPTATSVGVTFGGMCAFWALVRMQTGRPPARPDAAPEPTPAEEPPVTLTRRQRREARHRFAWR